MIDVSIIIVSYNTKDFLKNCLDSIIKSVSTNVAYEIILVDNASTDGSIEEMKSAFGPSSSQEKKIKIIENKHNVGFAKANNIGIKKAEGKYILFLNSDTIIYSNVLETMVGFMDSHRNAGAATCFVRLPSGKLDDAAHRGFPTPWNAVCHFSGLAKLFPKTMFLNGYHYAWKDLDKVHEVDAIAGAFMIVRKEAGEAIGWWDEDYFFYGEDIDFCYMLKQKGWKVYFVPTVSILHYKGVSGGIKTVSKNLTQATKETRIIVTDARFNAMKIFYKKHYIHQYPKFITSSVLTGINFIHWLAKKKVD